MAAAWARRRGGVGGGLVGRNGGGAIVLGVFGLELVAGLRQSREAPWPVRPALGAGLRLSLRIAQAAGSGANQTCSPARSYVFRAAHDAALRPDGIEVIGTQPGAAAQAFLNF